MLVLAYILVTFIWGSTWYAISLQLGVTASEWSVAFRFFLASSLLFGWCFVTKRSLSFPLKTHFWIMLLGLFMFSSHYVFIYMSTQYLTSGLIAIGFSLLSLLSIVNARIFLKTPIELATVFSGIVGVIGLIMVFWTEVDHLSFESDVVFGLLLCLAGTFLASLGSTFSASKTIAALPSIPMTSWGMFYGAGIMALFALGMGKELTLDMRPEYWGSLLYLSLFGSSLTFTVYFWLIKNIGVAQSAYIMVLTPIVALLISTIFEDYTWTILSASGLALMVFGNVIMLQTKNRKKQMVSARGVENVRVEESPERA